MDEAPDNLRLRNALAQAYTASQDFSSAEVEYVKILEIQSNILNIWVKLARLRAAQGDRDAARGTIEEGLTAIPDAPDLLWGKAFYLESEGDIDGAIAIYEALYERLSASPIIANNLASLLSTHREDDDSLTRAKIISRRLKNTEIPAFQDTYGWILYRSGDINESIPYLEAAAEGLVNDPRVQYHLGAAYAAAGRTNEAQAQLTRALATIDFLGDPDLENTIRTQLDAIGGKSDP